MAGGGLFSVCGHRIDHTVDDSDQAFSVTTNFWVLRGPGDAGNVVMWPASIVCHWMKASKTCTHANLPVLHPHSHVSSASLFYLSCFKSNNSMTKQDRCVSFHLVSPLCTLMDPLVTPRLVKRLREFGSCEARAERTGWTHCWSPEMTVRGRWYKRSVCKKEEVEVHVCVMEGNFTNCVCGQQKLCLTAFLYHR